MTNIRNALSRLSEIASGPTSSDAEGLRYFLLTYQAFTEELVSVEEFGSAAAAEDAYSEAERESPGEGLQVLLFGARSLDAVKETHPHYFRERGDDTTESPALFAMWED